jgi:hypothetical protein
MRKRQNGLYLVELAIVGFVFLLILFTLIEFGRALYVMNSLGEATRRGARMAVVCPIGDAAIREVAVFNPSGGGGNSSMLAGLTTANVVVEYLDATGGVIGNPAASFTQVRSARVRIANFTHTFLIPFVNISFVTPGFPATLPRESLGIPRQGAITPC